MSVVINGDTGISGVNGTEATPAIKGGDADSGIFFGTDTASIATGGSQRLFVDAQGRVGIGESSPDALLCIKGDSNGSTAPTIRLKDGTDTREAWISNASGDLILAVGDNDNAIDGRITIFESGLLDYSTDSTASALRINNTGETSVGPVGGFLSSSEGQGFIFDPTYVDGGAAFQFINSNDAVSSIWMGRHNDGGNCSLNDTIGKLAWRAKLNNNYSGGSDVAYIQGKYRGNGNTRSGGIQFATLDNGSETVKLDMREDGSTIIGTNVDRTWETIYNIKYPLEVAGETGNREKGIYSVYGMGFYDQWLMAGADNDANAGVMFDLIYSTQSYPLSFFCVVTGANVSNTSPSPRGKIAQLVMAVENGNVNGVRTVMSDGDAECSFSVSQQGTYTRTGGTASISSNVVRVKLTASSGRQETTCGVWASSRLPILGAVRTSS